MSTQLKKSLFSLMMVSLFALPASAGNNLSKTKTFTQEQAGITYQLTTPDPLPIGTQKLSLKLMRNQQLLTGAKLTAVATMGDGMKSAVKIISKPSGELEFTTKFSMAGKWQLKLQQSTPVKAEVKFDLMVKGGDHSGHHM